MKTNEKLVDTLIESGVKRAFTLPGLGITWTLPALYDRKDKLDLVLCRSEQVASIMAQATEPEDIIYGFQMAYKHASLPRKRPTALIMKTTAIREEFPTTPRTPLYPSHGYYAYTPPKPDSSAVACLARLINEAEFPVFVAGNGVYESGSGPALQPLASSVGAGDLKGGMVPKEEERRAAAPLCGPDQGHGTALFRAHF